MVILDDKKQPIRKRRHKGSRKTGKIPFDRIEKVIRALEAEASLPEAEKKRIALENAPGRLDRSLAGLEQRQKARMSVGSWRLLLVIGIPLYTGYRSVDCVKLLWSDLVYLNHDGSLTVRDTLTTKEQKTAKRREVPINNDLAFYIIRAFQEAKPRSLEMPVFKPLHAAYSNRVVRPGEAIKRLQYGRLIGHAFARFGVYDGPGMVAPHSLRKSYAWFMFEKLGGDMFALLQMQQILNHSSIDDTIRYLDITLESAHAAVKGLSFRGEGSGSVQRHFKIASIN